MSDNLVLGAAVPLPAIKDPMFTLSPVEEMVGECDVVTEGNIMVLGGGSDTEIVGTPAVVAMVGMNTLPIRNDAPFDYGDSYTAWIVINGYQCEIVDGVTVCYGGNLCDSDESDWEDPYDIASQQYVDNYNFDVPEEMDLMVFERNGWPSGSEMLDEVQTGLTLVCQTSLSVPDDKLDIVNIDPLAKVASATRLGTVADDSPTIWGGGRPYNCETMLCADEAIGNVDEGSLEDDERNSWADWCDAAFRTAVVHFRRRRTIRSQQLRSVADCFRTRC